MQDHRHSDRPHDHNHNDGQNHDHKHDHSHAHGHHYFSGSENKLLLVFVINLVMSAVEFVGGYSTNSTAILSDALHDFGDAIALGVGYLLERFSKRKGDDLFSFGYRRFSLLGALFSSVILVVGSTLILSEVIPRLLHPEAVNHEGMFLLALLGLATNGFSFWLLQRGSSVNEKVLSLHMLEDILGWAAVLVVSVVLFFKDIPVLDPVLSILITTVILFNVYKNLKTIFYIFMQGVPKAFEAKRIEDLLLKNTNIEKVYHTHVWSLDGEKHVLTTHILVKASVTIDNYTEIQTWIRAEIQKIGLWHSTLEIEFNKNSNNNC